MLWIILAGIAVLAYQLFSIVKASKEPKIICKRHEWVEAILMDENRNLSPFMFCNKCGMIPSADLEETYFIEKE